MGIFEINKLFFYTCFRKSHEFYMVKHFNNPAQKNLRRSLRKNQTYMENILWIYLRDRNLNRLKFRRQYSVDKYVIDFYCPEIKLAIELDGDVHDCPEVKIKDHIREECIAEYGISIIRIKNEEIVSNSDKVFKKLEEKINELKNTRSK